MNKFFKSIIFLFISLFLYSCGVGEALQGKKRSDQGDEFLIDKKNPLTMPPDYDKLPKPGEASAKSTSDIRSDQSSIKDLLKSSQIEKNLSSTKTPTSLEEYILKKIK